MEQKILTTTELVDIVIKIGKMLLENGAEIYRVEESMRFLCKAYGATRYEVYAVPASIIVSVRQHGEPAVTNTRRIISRGIDLDRINELNSLCRSLCENPQPLDYIKQRLSKISHRKPYNKWVVRISFGFVGTFFCLIFGGTIVDSVVSYFACFVLKLVLDFLKKFQLNTLFENIVGGMVISLIAYCSKHFGLCQTYDYIIIGSIMTLVPGLAITNSMRDLIAGDTISGMTKFAETLLIAVGIAIGVALPLMIVGGING